ncbi:MAG TPA: PAS domain S-box protein [Novimethylophilus sp.]|jgi:PAS domain S-box-containing protein|uniref:PAS domain S-box protein n=1 Tax=Novimethylophilus sp. TaxID=2137426 RepID=UPI002F3F95D1
MATADFFSFRSLPGWLGAPVLSALTLAVSLCVTYGLWQSARHDAAQNLQTLFDFSADETLGLIERRVAAYKQVLRGVQGLFASSGSVEEDALRRYVTALRLAERYPGMLGVGYVPVSAEMRNRPSNLPKGQEIFIPVGQAETFTGESIRLLERTLHSDPTLRLALMPARDSDSVIISSKVTFARKAGGKMQPGFMLLVPVYGQDQPHDTAAARRANILGWVYVPVRIGDAMAGINEKHASELDFEIYDGDAATENARMYDDDGVPVGEKPGVPRLRSIKTITVAGHPWTLVVSSLPAFEARLNKEKPQLVAFVGIVLSLMLTLLGWLLVTARARALAHATAMTRELRDSEEHFRTYFERSMVGMATTNVEKGWIKINDTLCQILGYARDELMRLAWERLIYAEDLAADMAQSDRLRKGEIDSYTTDKRFVHKDGHLVYTRLSVRSIRNSHGDIDYIMVQVEDITEGKAARDRDHLLISALEAVGNCVIITDPNSRVEWVNQAFERLTGYRREEALGRRSGGLMKSGMYGRGFYETMWRTILAGKVWRGEIVNRRKDGSLYYDELVIAPVKNAVGEICNFVAVNQDITERKQIEEEIRRLNNVLEQRVNERTAELTSANTRLRDMTHRLIEVQEVERRRLAGELHDRIGSNLTAIGLNLRLMENAASSDIDTETADRVADCVALVEDTMVCARDISADLHPATLDYVGLLPALEEFGEKFERRTGIAIEVKEIGRRIRLPAQIEIALFRIAQEALTNCAKHAKTKLVTIALEITARRVIFSIADTGEGFDVTRLGVDGDKPGLGLLSMRERAEAIGGQLRIESVPGRGTTIVAETILTGELQ